MWPRNSNGAHVCLVACKAVRGGISVSVVAPCAIYIISVRERSIVITHGIRAVNSSAGRTVRAVVAEIRWVNRIELVSPGHGGPSEDGRKCDCADRQVRGESVRAGDREG